MYELDTCTYTDQARPVSLQAQSSINVHYLYCKKLVSLHRQNCICGDCQVSKPYFLDQQSRFITYFQLWALLFYQKICTNLTRNCLFLNGSEKTRKNRYTKLGELDIWKVFFRWNANINYEVVCIILAVKVDVWQICVRTGAMWVSIIRLCLNYIITFWKSKNNTQICFWVHGLVLQGK